MIWKWACVAGWVAGGVYGLGFKTKCVAGGLLFIWGKMLCDTAVAVPVAQYQSGNTAVIRYSVGEVIKVHAHA
jgi:hypothetical protein